jgi:hypothetical protein
VYSSHLRSAGQLEIERETGSHALVLLRRKRTIGAFLLRGVKNDADLYKGTDCERSLAQPKNE